MVDLTLSDTLRNWINEKVTANYDYSLASSRKADLDNFILDNKARGWKSKSVRPSFHRILDEVLKNKGINPKSLGRQVKKPKYGGEMESEITPKPVAGEPPKQNTTEPPAPQVQGVGQQQIVPVNPYTESFDADGVAATFSAITLMFRLAIPEFESLSEKELNSLGKMWLPFFKRYMTENWALVGIPLLATTGMLLPKIIKAKKLHKENDEKKKQLDSQKKDKEKQEKKDKEKKNE